MEQRNKRLLWILKTKRPMKRVSNTVLGFFIFIIILVICLNIATGSIDTTVSKLADDIKVRFSVSLSYSYSNVLQYIGKDRDQLYTSKNGILSRIYPLNRYLSQENQSGIISYVLAKNTVTEENDSKLGEDERKNFLLLNDIDEQKRLENSGVSEDYIEDSDDTDTDINLICGESYFEDDSSKSVETFQASNHKFLTLEQLQEYPALVSNCYIVDPTTATSDTVFDVKKFMNKDMSIEIIEDQPQVLIYHTHSQEAYVDSRKGRVEDTVVGVGSYLTEILENKYGIKVIHDTTEYDLVDGNIERSMAYNVAGPSIAKTLEYNPSIEVVIDLHRDGVSSQAGKRLAKIQGNNCAQLMFFNGLSYNNAGPITTLTNPYIEDNLAFSFQLFYHSKQKYDGLCTKTYLKAYRYNMHLCPKSLLVELGTQYNTVDEAKNSMEYFAELLNDVLTGKNK